VAERWQALREWVGSLTEGGFVVRESIAGDGGSTAPRVVVVVREERTGSSADRHPC
jgi:hypothetical protein